jgi:hypothetical protein
MTVSVRQLCKVTIALLGLSAAGSAMASSHREAPFITEIPKLDSTDFYLFRSYEAGRDGFITVVANYQPLQDAYGGPNYFTMDPDAAYDIHLDNDGDAKEDLTFRFRFDVDLANRTGLTVDAGGKQVAIPLVQRGPISAADRSNVNVIESYQVDYITGDSRSLRNVRAAASVTNAANGQRTFLKPTDYIGTKTFGPAPGYDNYARAHIYDVRIPGCQQSGRLFVGQRKESFAVNLGVVFDLINAPAQVVVGGIDRNGRNLAPSTIADKNITSLALELPIACVTRGSSVVAGWTSSSLRQVRVVNPRGSFELPAFEAGALTQVSRLSTPLVNELVIGLKDKNLFNGSHPTGDGQFAEYVTNPTLPELIELLFGAAGVVAPNQFPRADLVAAFLTGVTGVNANGSTAEMLRLNTAIPATPKGSQNSLGAAQCFVFGNLVLTNPGCDPAGFPNGRRPGDDTVDIALRVAMGFLLPQAAAPSGQLAFTDAVLQEDAQFDAGFPYLTTPTPGAR